MNKKEYFLSKLIVNATWRNRVEIYKLIDFWIVSNDPSYKSSVNEIKDVKFIPNRIDQIFNNFKVTVLKEDDFLQNPTESKFSFTVLNRKSKVVYRVLVGEFIGNNIEPQKLF